jgi:hypothetical protein
MTEPRVSPSAEAMDPFLKTMTFAQAFRCIPSCDCDECGVGGSRSDVPEPIRRAVRQHNRWRKLKRSQLRELVHRGRHVVLWRWTLPMNAEPLIEYGNPNVHRLIWVKRLAASGTNSTSTLKCIGSGVVGSASEEQSRISVPWTQGSVVHVKSHARKAVGWVSSSPACTNDASPDDASTAVVATKDGSSDRGTDAVATNANPIVLYIAKVSISEGSTDEDTDERLETIRKLCYSSNAIESDEVLHAGKLLSADDSDSFQRAFTAFLGPGDE